jgi:Sec-independent protein translocase protein TatA
VMSGFFRPALMVLGLVASNVVLSPAVQYINAGFLVAFQSVQANSTTGLLSIGGYSLVYCAIITATFMLVFGLPQTLPDRILRWIGAGVGDMGEQSTASKIEQSASSQSRMAATHGATAKAEREKQRMKESMEKREETHNAAMEKMSMPEGIGGQSNIPPPPTANA